MNWKLCGHRVCYICKKIGHEKDMVEVVDCDAFHCFVNYCHPECGRYRKCECGKTWLKIIEIDTTERKKPMVA